MEPPTPVFMGSTIVGDRDRVVYCVKGNHFCVSKMDVGEKIDLENFQEIDIEAPVIAITEARTNVQVLTANYMLGNVDLDKKKWRHIVDLSSYLSKEDKILGLKILTKSLVIFIMDDKIVVLRIVKDESGVSAKSTTFPLKEKIRDFSISHIDDCYAITLLHSHSLSYNTLKVSARENPEIVIECVDKVDIEEECLCMCKKPRNKIKSVEKEDKEPRTYGYEHMSAMVLDSQMNVHVIDEYGENIIVSYDCLDGTKAMSSSRIRNSFLLQTSTEDEKSISIEKSHKNEEDIDYYLGQENINIRLFCSDNDFIYIKVDETLIICRVEQMCTLSSESILESTEVRREKLTEVMKIAHIDAFKVSNGILYTLHADGIVRAYKEEELKREHKNYFNRLESSIRQSESIIEDIDGCDFGIQEIDYDFAIEELEDNSLPPEKTPFSSRNIDRYSSSGLVRFLVNCQLDEKDYNIVAKTLGQLRKANNNAIETPIVQPLKKEDFNP